MTVYRHLPASAASVLLGTALLLACAPKAQAAEKAQDETSIDTKSELIQEKAVESANTPVGDQTAEKQEVDQKKIEKEATSAVEATAETDKVTAQTDKESSQTADVKTATVKPKADNKAAEAISETKDKEDTSDKTEDKHNSDSAQDDVAQKESDARIKSALDQIFDHFKFLEMPIDTFKGATVDPSQILANAYPSFGMHFEWVKAPETNKVGEQKVSVKVTIPSTPLLDYHKPDNPEYEYTVVLHTTVTVHEKESDYAMIYGEPGEGKGRNYLVYYDVDKQEPIAKRVFYGEDGNSEDYDFHWTDLAINQTPYEWAWRDYQEADGYHTPTDYSNLLESVISKPDLKDNEKKIIKDVFANAERFGADNYNSVIGDVRINNFSKDRLSNLVVFLTSMHRNDEPVFNEGVFWGDNLYDYTTGHAPDPRVFISNWDRLPAGSTAWWVEQPIVGEPGVINTPVMGVRINNKTRYISFNGEPYSIYGKRPYFDAAGEPTDPDDYYKHPYFPVINDDIPTVTVGNLPSPKIFIKYWGTSDPNSAEWLIKPDVTRPGYTMGFISVDGGSFILVNADVVEPTKPTPPKNDPDPKPQPDPKPDPEPEPQPDPDPIPVPTPDPLLDIAEDPDKDEDDDKPEDKKSEEKKQTKQTTKKVVTKTSVVEHKPTKSTVQQKRAALPQTGNKGLIVLALGAAVSIIGLGLLRKKKL